MCADQFVRAILKVGLETDTSTIRHRQFWCRITLREITKSYPITNDGRYLNGNRDIICRWVWINKWTRCFIAWDVNFGGYIDVTKFHIENLWEIYAQIGSTEYHETMLFE